MPDFLSRQTQPGTKSTIRPCTEIVEKNKRNNHFIYFNKISPSNCLDSAMDALTYTFGPLQSIAVSI